MRILIATIQVPFIRGGAEIHAEGLHAALRAAGHQAEIIAVPFKWYPPEKVLDHMLACRLLDLSEVMGTPVDLLIGLKFPAYLIPHDNKVLWILHQFRTAYELWDHPLGDLIHEPNGIEVRDAIREADRQILSEARRVFSNSANVAARLKFYCGFEASPLYHPPPGAEEFYSADAEDFFFFPSRLCLPKRQSLVLEALALTRHPIRVVFAGAADEGDYLTELTKLADHLGLETRVEWLGYIADDRKRELYAKALAIIYPPIDEDFGYVTLEGMLARKPVVVCSDSGGPLEFVRHEQNGLIVEPTPQALAQALDRVWDDRLTAKRWGIAGYELYRQMDISWTKVVESLVG
ncbi:MAG TPA: glycosyltransferase family 4 protein [Pyrinomonadaceae bacterium]|nr:glycosyltransferase family 4 protein [Pyrinomonadaceae bacterium]